MKPEIKARWVTALRSGSFKQGKDQLRAEDLGGTPYYCCLGVLCDIYLQDNKMPWPEAYATLDFPDEELLPTEVMDWAGLNENNPHVEIDGINDSPSRTLSTLNDDLELSFDRIADAIEASL